MSLGSPDPSITISQTSENVKVIVAYDEN